MRLFNRALEIIQNEGIITFWGKFIEFTKYKYRDPLYHIKYGFGSTRVCPICGWKGSQFYPHGPNRRNDSRCPGCNAKERHRFLHKFLSDKKMIKPDDEILYFAPTRHLEAELKKNCNVTTTDLSMNTVTVQSDITQLPFKNGCFNGLICSHVLEHVPDDESALEEIYRVLRPNGWALILVPQRRNLQNTYENRSINTRKERKKEFGHPDHVRWYNSDIKDVITSYGFDVTVISTDNLFNKESIEKYGLKEKNKCFFDSSRLFYCEK